MEFLGLPLAQQKINNSTPAQPASTHMERKIILLERLEKVERPEEATAAAADKENDLHGCWCVVVVVFSQKIRQIQRHSRLPTHLEEK